MNADVEQKQKFLFNEIMRKGYDADDFTRWIDSTKEKGMKKSHRMSPGKMDNGGIGRSCARVPI